MNKKEINEIKKNLSTDSGLFSIGKVLSAFVDSEKNIVYQSTSLYNLLPSDEAELILENLRKTLSGTLGKNLREYAFPKEQYDEDGAQSFLYKVLESKLENDELNAELVNRLAKSCISTTAVFAAHCTYSVLKKNKMDETTDEADFDYSFIIAAICPVELRSDGLVFNDGNGKIEKKATFDRIVGTPSDGILFPVFSDRASDVNSVMHYTKTYKKPNVSFVENTLGCEFTMSAVSEKAAFHKILSNVASDELDYDLITCINEKIREYVDSTAYETEPATVDAGRMKTILWESGIPQDKLDLVPKVFESATDQKPLIASNLVERKTVVEAEGITVNISKASADKVTTQTIGGRRCLVIELDDEVSVNGMSVN